MQLDQLRYFVAAATHGGYTAGAKVQAVTQPHLYRRVKALQIELGVQLFEKSGRNVVLTRAGESLLPEVQHIVRLCEKLRLQARLIRDGTRDAIRISGYPIHVPTCLGPLIRDFMAMYPHLGFDLGFIRDDRARDGKAIIEDLMDGKVDFAISTEQRGIDGIDLYRSAIVVVLPDEHPLRDQEAIGMDELRGSRLLVTPRGHYTREQVETCLNDLPSDDQRPVVAAEMSTAVALIALGEAGVGIPVIADLHLSESQHLRRYPVLSGPLGPILTTIKLHVHPTKPLRPSAQTFFEFVENGRQAAQ